jgi:hypothetical protein
MSQAYVVAEENNPGFVTVRVCVTSGTAFKPESDPDCWHTVAPRSRAVGIMNIARHIADTLNEEGKR